jgi:putative chitinase
MTQGLFTGVNLSRYFNDQREDYVSARKIINGTDKADLIALYAKKFLNCILM